MLTTHEFSAGYEHIYDFVDHMFGAEGSHQGIRVNMNHYRGNLTSRIQAGDKGRQGFFSPAQCRAFLQSGIACWLQGFPDSVDEPCCDLSCIGGDGTSIGTSQKRGIHLKSIWTPLEPRAPSVRWGRNDRRVTAWSPDPDGHPDPLIRSYTPALDTAELKRQSVSACNFVLDTSHPFVCS